MIAGFDEFPAELRDTDTVTVQCVSDETTPEACGDWETTVNVSPEDVMMDNLGMIHFDEPPSECPECGNYVLLSYNGVEVFREP